MLTQHRVFLRESLAFSGNMLFTPSNFDQLISPPCTGTLLALARDLPGSLTSIFFPNRPIGRQVTSLNTKDQSSFR